MDKPDLSLGDMLTFIGLIVAAYQLAKPRYMLVWRLSSKTLKSLAIALLSAGYLSPFAAVISPEVKDINLLWLTLSLSELLQTLGFLLITLGALVIIYIFSHYNRSHLITEFTRYKFSFNKYPQKKWRTLFSQVERDRVVTTKSARKFYEITSMFLVRGHIKEVVEIIYYNLDILTYAAKQYQPRFHQSEKSAKSRQEKSLGANYAFEVLLQILTDDAAMKHICTSDSLFLHSVVWQEKENSNGAYDELSNVLYPNILQHLVLNSNSFLYSQKEEYNGTSRFANVYELLTDKKIITRQNIVPGQLTWHVSKTDLPLDAYVEVLSKLLSKMIAHYKQNPADGEILNNIRSILDQLIGTNGVIRRIAYDKKARARHAADYANSVEANILRTIEIDIIHDLYKDDDPDSFKTSKVDLEAANEKYYHDHKSLTSLIAYKVSELIQDMTVLYRGAEEYDHKMRMILSDYIDIYAHTPVANHYRELVLERLLDKGVYEKWEIGANIKGYFPNVLRPLIDYLIPFTPNARDATLKAQHKLQGVMANELKEAILSGKKMRSGDLMKDVLLPSDVRVVVSKDKSKVTYYSLDQEGKKTIIRLDTPLASASVK